MSQVWCCPCRVQTVTSMSSAEPIARFLFCVDLPPVGRQQPGAQQQIERHAAVGHQHVRSGGVVALRGDRVGDGQQEITKLRRRQKDPRQSVQPPGLPGFLLHQNGDILIEQVDHQHHAAQKQPVNSVVHKPLHGVQTVHRKDGHAIQHQMNQHRDQQHGKGSVQRRPLLVGGKIHAGHKGHHQKQRDFHPQHGRPPS